MKYSVIILINLLTMIFAIVVVWVYARESFEFVVLLLGIYFLWVVAKLVLEKKKLKRENLAGSKETKISVRVLG